jgi:hypothetical protein
MRGVLAVCALALAARAALSVISLGSNDIEIWRIFARQVTDNGVIRVYELNSWFNHPPLMGYYAAAALRLAEATGIRFSIVFKVVPILASVATVFAVQRRAQLSYGVLLLFALNPTDVLVSAYHGNTDSLCAALGVASVLCATGGMAFSAGLALAAALNVKLVPIVLVAPLLLSFHDRRAMLRFTLGLMVAVVPFLPVLWRVPDEFVFNAITYNSLRAQWGIGLFVFGTAAPFPKFSEELWALLMGYGKTAILATSVALALCQLWLRAFSRWQLCAYAFAVFLVLAPGFGPQYLVYPTALLLLADVSTGLRYGYLAGLFAGLVYYGFWTRTFPAYSYFRALDQYTFLLGFAVWLLLAAYLYAGGKQLYASARAWVLAGSDRIGNPRRL